MKAELYLCEYRKQARRLPSGRYSVQTLFGRMEGQTQEEAQRDVCKICEKAEDCREGG